MTKDRNRPKKILILKYFIPLFILLLITTACSSPTQDPVPPTEPSQATQAPVVNSPLPPTFTSYPGTLPPTPSPTFTSPPPTVPSTPIPFVEVTGNTNCRTGPGSVYDWLYTYLAGNQALILGKSADEAFWFTSDENGINPDCWLWGKYATPVGDTSFVPVFTPPPTPTPRPNFAISYEGSDCGAGSCWLWFKIDNTGSIKWESVLVYTKNIVTFDDAVNLSNTFKNSVAGADIPNVPVGGTGYTHSERLPNPSGNTVDVYIVACEKDNLTEICQVRNLTVNP